MHVKQLILKHHAFERYCQRVGPIEYEELEAQCLMHLGQPCKRKRDYIKLGNAWWRYGYRGGIVTLHTCYGEQHIDDLPAAIRWAKQYNDRIQLGDDHGL